MTSALDGATGVLQDSVEELDAPVSKATTLLSSSETLVELSESIGGVEIEMTVAEVTVAIVDLAMVGVDPDSSGSVKLSAVSNGGVEGGFFGSFEHVNMSDSDVVNLEGVERDCAEHDLPGVQ